jgi:hypothetical protein
MVVNLCFVGGHGVGKRTALLQYLRKYAQGEGIPFQIKTKYLMGKLLNTVSSTNGTAADDDSDDDDGPATTQTQDEGGPSPDGKSFPFEVSAIHQGYDIARMSLQDKNYIYTIFKGFTGSSYVLSKSNYHFFVFYHAHLLSEESIIYLQEKLEQYSSSLRIFLTSNYPLPLRLADHFLEIEVPSIKNQLYTTIRTQHPTMGPVPGWSLWFRRTLEAWNTKAWTTADIPAIRQWIYFCLQRNLRWCEMIEYWTNAIKESELPAKKKVAIFRILTFAEGGGGWQIIPSYRIPLLWEYILLDIVKVLRND